MDTYKKESIFSDSLEEFDNSRETVQSLIEEYTAAEKENYLDWGTNEDMNENDWHHHFYRFIFYSPSLYFLASYHYPFYKS